MYKQLGLVDLISAVQGRVEARTGLKCYDHAPKDTLPPFYFAEVISKKPANSKTMYRDIFTVALYCAAGPDGSPKGVYDLIDSLEEAMSEDIELPDDFELIMQTNGGVQTIKTDETGQKHAVLTYEFTVCYGFIYKTGGNINGI